jgi:hypothetical protein
LIAGQSTGSFSTKSGAVSKSAYIAEKAYTFEMTDTYGDGICYQYGAGEFKITVIGEPGDISSSGKFRGVVRESFDVVGRSTGPTVDYRLDVAYDDYPYETSWSLQSLTTDAVATAFGFSEGTERGYLLSQSAGLVPGNEYQLVILDSVGDGMCCGYGDGFTQLWTILTCSLRQATVCQS